MRVAIVARRLVRHACVDGPRPTRAAARPAPQPAGGRHRLGDLLRQPGFRGLWLAQTVSQVGTQITLLAMPLVAILELGATPLEVGILGAVDFLPFLLFTLPAGVWVDRLHRRRILIAADIGRALVLAIVPIAYVGGVLAMWQLYVVGFIAGTLTVFFDVGYQAFLPELVPRERLPEGNSRLEVSRSAAQVVGPGLAGVSCRGDHRAAGDPRGRRQLRRLVAFLFRIPPSAVRPRPPRGRATGGVPPTRSRRASGTSPATSTSGSLRPPSPF